MGSASQGNQREFFRAKPGFCSAEQQQPQISRVKMFSQEVERSGDQAQDARKHERRAHRFTGRQPNDQDESRHGEAAAANAGQTYSDSYNESQQEAHSPARFEKV